MENERARIRWRCRRGLLELDVLLQRFMDRGYDALSQQQRQSFLRLLDIPDSDLLAYLQGTKHCSDRELKEIVNKIK